MLFRLLERNLLWLLIIALLVLIIPGMHCLQNSSRSEDKIEIAASIAPIADFVRQVGGEHVNVFIVVSPNTDPHTFELTPELLIRISQARMLVINGVGLEFWAPKIKSSVNRDNFNIIDTSVGVPVFEETDTDHAEAEHNLHPSGNPHIWLDPQNAIIQVNNIKNALIMVDSVHSAIYQKNAENYIKLLLETDAEFSREISNWKMKKFICFHPAWDYFARRYGLEQAGVIQKSPGSEPGPREVAGIIDSIKKLQVKAIFTEVQFPGGLTQSIAQEGKISVITLDPIGSFINITNYIDMMKYNVRQMAGAMKE